MKNSTIAIITWWSTLMLPVIFFSVSACHKQTQESIIDKDPFEVEKQITELVDNTFDPSVPLFDEPTTFTEEQIRIIYDNQNIWTLEELKDVINDSRSSFDVKYNKLKAKLPVDRVENEQTLETFCKRQTGYIQDSNPNHLAQVIAASGQVVGVNSSLNIFRPINDNGTVTFFDIYISQIRQAQTIADQVIEYIPESMVFEYQVSGGNWLIGVDIVHNVGIISDTIHYCFNCPNGSLIWNPTLNSPVDDDVIQGGMPNGVVSISANGLTPPPPID